MAQALKTKKSLLFDRIIDRVNEQFKNRCKAFRFDGDPITAIRRSFVQINSGQGRRLDHIMVGHALQGEIGSQFTGTLARSTTELGVAFVILVEINGDGTPQENYQRAIKTIDNLEDELVLYLEQDYVVASGGSRSKASEDGFDGLQVGDVAPIPDETGQHLLREVVVSFSLTKYV